LRELEKVRAQGYAVDHEESEIGLVCFSAPLFDHRGDCVAAMSLSGPTTRMYARSEEFIAGVLQASREVSKRLGYQP
jgi:DNA-binding IclR family transcriptional regulator